MSEHKIKIRVLSSEESAREKNIRQGYILKFVMVDRYMPEEYSNIEVCYAENVSRVYTQPELWKELERVMMRATG